MRHLKTYEGLFYSDMEIIIDHIQDILDDYEVPKRDGHMRRSVKQWDIGKYKDDYSISITIPVDSEGQMPGESIARQIYMKVNSRRENISAFLGRKVFVAQQRIGNYTQIVIE